MRKKVFLEGHWMTNLGDDLFLKIICDRYPEVDFFIEIEKKHKKVFDYIDNLYMFNKKINLLYKIKQKFFHKYFKNSSYLNKYKEIPIYIEIGGSIFMMPRSIKEKRGLQKRISIRSKAEKYFVIGSNFGPYFFDEQIKEYSDFFNTLDGIVFRDKQSKEYFSNHKNIKVAADIVLGLKLDNNLSNSTVKNVVISVIDLEKRDKVKSEDLENYERYLVKNIIDLIEKGNSITLMSFCKEEGDENAAKRILNNVPSNIRHNVSIYNHVDIEKSLQVLKNSSKIIATRFHSMILGWILKKPTFVISYSDKTLNVISDIYPNQSYIKIEDIMFDNMLIGDKDFTIIPDDKLYRAAASSEKQFSYIDSILK